MNPFASPPVVQAVAVGEIAGADATPLLQATAVEYSPLVADAELHDQRDATLIDKRGCRDEADDVIRRANDIGKFEADRERALIAGGERHADVANPYDARRTPQYRDDAAAARKEAAPEDTGARDIAYEDRDPYRVDGLSRDAAGEYKASEVDGEYQCGEYETSTYECADYKSVYDK